MINKAIFIFSSAALAASGWFCFHQDAPKNTVDYNLFSEKWKYICVTSYGSGEPYFPIDETRPWAGHLKVLRQIGSFQPKDFDENNIYIYLVQENGDMEVRPMPISEADRNVINPLYGNLYSISGYSQCAERRNAVLKCVPVENEPLSKGKCRLLFETRKSEKR